ncbi:MAG: FAD-binding oxidoreductase, partial [Beggiatoa sp. IS2]
MKLNHYSNKLINNLATELRTQLIGSEVRFDEASRALYATDSSNYRQIPIGVVIPRTVDDLVKTTEIARRYEVPLLVRGAGTSLAGQACNVALIIDTSKYLNKIIKIDAEQQLAWVEPGVILDDLRMAAEQYQLTFGPDPATHNRCTLGGMIGNNASGVHSVTMGKTVDNVTALEILTYDGLRLWVGKTSENELTQLIESGGRCGEIYRNLKMLRDQYAPLIREKFPKIPRRVSGYNLDELLPENDFHVARALVGTESTCVLVLQAIVKLCPSPQHRVLLVFGFTSIDVAGDVTSAILPYHPLCIEGLDADMIDDMRKKSKQLRNLDLLPSGRAWLLVEFGGYSLEESVAKAQLLIKEVTFAVLDYRLLTDPVSQKQVWAIRESGAAATNSVPGEPETYPGWEDAAVDPHHLGDYLRDFRHLLDQYSYKSSLYGHFGEGCVHARINFDLHQPEGLRQWRGFLVEATDLVVKYGGSLSGEHGDGQARAELLPRMFGDELVQAFSEFKAIWDPQQRMNPGKIVKPYPIDADLRVGPNYQPWQPSTYFSFHQDQGNFAKAVNRCVGVGKCRRTHGGLMCPSYKVTREEQYSTRGRAHLLFEMLQGELLRDQWNTLAIKQALELCLACKGCKHECPVAVDIATYKAEFMAHYYANHWRPLQAQVLGKLPQLAYIAS